MNTPAKVFLTLLVCAIVMVMTVLWVHHEIQQEARLSFLEQEITCHQDYMDLLDRQTDNLDGQITIHLLARKQLIGWIIRMENWSYDESGKKSRVQGKRPPMDPAGRSSP